MREALKPVLSHPNISSAIVGFSSVEEVDEIAALFESNRHGWTEETIETPSLAFGNAYCRMCKYCCPCEVHGWSFDFPKILRIVSLLMRVGWNDELQKEYNSLGFSASMCTSCGKCERKCPFGLPVSSLLKVAAHWLDGGGGDHPKRK